MADNLRAVRARIASAAAASGRNVDSITLVGVGKSQPVELLRAAAAAGLKDFGENYVQEALGKLDALADLPLTWHFIGQLQANKTRAIATRFDWVHSIDRLRLAQRLSEQRPFHGPPLNVCVQLNLAGESSKGGVALAEVPALLAGIALLPRLKLRGLMCVPPAESDPDRQRHWFGQVRHVFETLNAQGAALDTLSMGMSADLEAAVAEGATIVRVGTALFGPRSQRMREPHSTPA